MKTNLTTLNAVKRTVITLVLGVLFLLANTSTNAQLGTYTFTGAAACPNQNPNVTAQPANATFGAFTSQAMNCYATTDVYATAVSLNTTSTIDLNEYNTFTVTATGGAVLDLDSLTFDTYAGIASANCKWTLRSSLDNYTTNIASDSNTVNTYKAKAILPSAVFQYIPSVTFRLYITNSNVLASWGIDNVKLYGRTVLLPAIPASPTSNSPQCAFTGVTINATGTPPAGVTWYWQTSATGTSTANAAASLIVNTSGTHYIRAKDDVTNLWSNGASSISVVANPDVVVPVFTALGATSTRCEGNANVNYTASAGPSSITYSLDAASLAAGNAINAGNGQVNYTPTWVGTAVITATVNGCNGPKTATHTATTTANVASPTLNNPAPATRCQGSGNISFACTAANATSITYSIPGTAIAAGNSIDANGLLTFSPTWVGSITVTVAANGCNPQVANFAIVTTATVGTPVFSATLVNTRCQGAATVTYTATATTNTGITYSLDATSAGAGNMINTATGAVTYVATWAGTTIITATAGGCNGPKSKDYNVTVSPYAVSPVFAIGSTSTRCQGLTLVTYTATATNATSINYAIDAISATAGNTINATTGVVRYAATWTGTTIVTATPVGCIGSASLPTTHTITTTPTVSVPVFTLGATSIRCQGAGTATYVATATNSTSIIYKLDSTSLANGNTINATTGVVNFVSTWSGTSKVTATPVGCNDATVALASHIITITPFVGNPAFTLGAESVRNQAAITINYGATATNNTGITYTLDVASLAAGNTIVAATGAVTWVAGWYGTSAITANANGCNSSSTGTHIVITNPIVVQTPLYLSTGQSLDRVDPVATNIIPTIVSNPISTTASGVQVDATTNSIGSSITMYTAHTTGTGANRFMLVGISQPNRLVTSVTYAGLPLTLVGENNINNNARVAIYSLVNPPSGSGIVTVNFNGSPTAGAIVGVTTFTGVDQANPLNSNTYYTSEAGGSTNPYISLFGLSPVPGELIFDVVATKNLSLSTDVGQTQKWNQFSGYTTVGGGSIKPATANTYMSWFSAKGDWAIMATSIKPAASQTTITFTQNPALCNNLTIKAQTVQVLVHTNVTSGTMPVNPAITASLKYGSTTIISLSNPVYNSASKILSWTGALATDVTVPSGQSLKLDIATAQAGVQFQLEYHSKTKPSRISLLPVSTFVDILSFDVYSAPYPNGIKRQSGKTNKTYYVRAVVSTPFGYQDISGLDMNFAPLGTTVPVACVDSTACTRTYEYVWNTPNVTGIYDLLATAKEGYEGIIKNSEILYFDLCSFCPPVAAVDSASGSGGAPIVINVLTNDYDPNENIKLNTLAIIRQPNNGTGYVSNNQIIYLPNGTFAGKDTLEYRICDSTGLCGTAFAYFTINPLIIDPCSEATQTHNYFIPYPEQDAYIALQASSSSLLPSGDIRTVISLTLPYPSMTIVWDQWEDGYETNPLAPSQPSTKVWGDGNPYNGIAPGYASDIIPAGGSIILDNTMAANPRVVSNFFYDGKDRITSSGQVAVTQVCGEPTNMPVQAIKTNVTSTFDFGQSFTIPLGENFSSQDFRYTALFVRAEQDGTTVQIDKDNDGTLETNFSLNKGQSYLVNGGVKVGATVTSDKPVGVELNAGGVDGWSIRNAPIYPATWYSNTYYTPVPTSDNSGDNPKDTSVVMFYNSLNRPITINWTSGVPANGTIVLPAKSVKRFPLAYSTTAAYKFVNPTGESFTAIEIVDSYTPGTGGNDGQTYDWAFNLIAESRLTDYATTAWAPGGLDLVAPAGPDVNGNPIWVTPSTNTTIYVKWDGKVSGNVGLVSPCGLRYDVAIPLNALNYTKLRDPNDNDQSGLAVFTCNGAKIAAVYGEDPQGSGTGVGVAYWDVGTTILPFCKQKLIFANDDYGRTVVNQPVTLPILVNDFGYLAVVDPTTVSMSGLLQPKNGSVTINPNGSLIYTPNNGYVGKDTFEYRVCSTPVVVCDNATVYIDISSCPAPYFQNIIGGQVYLDKNADGISNDGGIGIAGPKVYLYTDGNCNGIINANELSDSVTVDASGTYQFITYPEKFVADDFDGAGGVRTCANGTDGNAAWLTNWVDAGDPSVGFCNTLQNAANTDADIFKDATFTNALRMKGSNVSATRTVNLNGASYAFLSFSYRRKSATLAPGEDVIVQASTNGSSFGTIFTIPGDGNADANYVDIYNQDITDYAGPNTYIRILTNNNVDDADTVYIDNIKIQYISYPQCYITKLDPTSVPQYYHTTSVLDHAITATSSQTCLSPFDFGITKDKLTISGTIYQDANGITDNVVNGNAIGTVEGSLLYAYLVDVSGKVANRTTVNSTTGNYIFTNADVVTQYKLQISPMSVNVGDFPPPIADFSSISGNWATTGDAYGINNFAGSGVEIGVANSSINVYTQTSNVTNVNFGIERMPESDDKVITYQVNLPNTQYAITGGLTGSDPEDGILGSGKTYRITELPYAAVLFYNGTAVTLNQVITNFNATLLSIDPDDDLSSTSFRYASMDAAGLYDPTPAIIIINWTSVLPINLISFDGKLNGTTVDLTWSTSAEINTSYFDVERSTTGSTFIKLAKVNAQGLSNTTTNYSEVDFNPEVGFNYYRLKVVDKDGKFIYSNIINIKTDAKIETITSIKPNPFMDKVDVNISLYKNSQVQISLLDVSGKKVYQKEVRAVKGANKITLTDLGQLPKGTYILKLMTDYNTFTEKLLKQ
jgi:Bacterial Ig domain/Secretion system C-terminal sorting domain